MNHKRKAFASHYLLSGNATEAAIKAGYSGKTAYSQGQRLLKNVEIMNTINEGQSKLQLDTEVKLIEVISKIKNLAFSGESEAIQLKALDMLMKHLGGYNDSLKLLSIMSEEQLESLAKRLLNGFE